MTFLLAVSLAGVPSFAGATSPVRASARYQPRLGGGKRSGHRHTRRQSHSRQSRARARAAIVGGQALAIEQVPWQVTVEAVVAASEGFEDIIRCGGSVIDSSHVLTAAHCVFRSSPNERIPVDDFTVHAGTSDLEAPAESEQEASVTGVRVHPYYSYVPNSGHVAPDDVAVLTLSQPLSLGPAVGSIGLVPLGLYPGEGTAVGFSGFGEENASLQEFNGKLYGLGMAIAYSRECGGENGADNAVLLCASAPAGSPCSGDSGSGLTAPGSPPVLVGVMNAVAVVAGKICVAGAFSSIANIAAPEIQDFIDGSETPPLAPRGGGASCVANEPTVGASMSCEAGTWSNSPTFTYVFQDGESGRALQSGSSSEYEYKPADVGHTVYMRLLATNAGGTGVDRTSTTFPVAPGAPDKALVEKPSKRVSLVGDRFAVRAGAPLLVTVKCTGGSRCEGQLKLTWMSPGAKGTVRKHSHEVLLGKVSFTVAGNHKAVLKLHLTNAGRNLLGAHHGRLEADLTIIEIQFGAKLTHSRSVALFRK
ncbi:MAG TPA: trypsin-like serine protease [Solirubrobacteraceae bacterium]